MTSWIDGTVWWHVYPLGFTAALHAGPGQRLRQLVDWLDYAAELGVSGLQLGPIFASHTHGYDVIDDFVIDPRLGDDGDFDALVAALRERGLRLLLDGVFNHVGPGFAAPAHWLRQTDSGEQVLFEGHAGLLALDHDEPEVLDHVVRVMEHWLDRGADGWRLDAAHAVPATFWRAALARLRPRHPQAWFTGELIHGDAGAFLHDTGLDSVTQYELWKAIWSSLNDGNFFELSWSLGRHAAFLDAGLPLTFVGNHDVTRIASQLTDERHLGHALAVLFTVGGVPSVYYGDEQGFRAVKEIRHGGDDAIRPPFPATPGELPPQGWPVYHLHRRLIRLRRERPWLTHARAEPAHLTNTAVALVCADAAGHRLVTLLNIGESTVEFPVDVAGLCLVETDTPGDGRPPASVPAHGWSILGLG